MSADAAASDPSSSRPTSKPVPAGNANANGTAPPPVNSNYRLRLNPNRDHVPENYEDLQSEYTPLLLSSLERYLPADLLNAPRETKYEQMVQILRRYSTKEERIEAMMYNEYRQRIISNYQPLYRELYELNATTFFVPSFINAFMDNDDNRKESIRNIMAEPVPGVYVFDMLQPHFCEMMLAEVENFKKWAHETKLKTMRPNLMNKYGVVLDDFGMEPMLQKLMKDFISHISKIFFADVGRCALDSHHGFVVEYGIDEDDQLGLHVDDSEVTLNVCLGKKFTGGELVFRGVRCDKHINSETLPEEILEYLHVPGRAIVHCGRHRHGARATTTGKRFNLVIWCRSAMFREIRQHMKGYASWCVECQREKREELRQAVDAKKMALVVGVMENMRLE